MLRSIGAVLAGYVVMAVGVMVGSLVAMAALMPGRPRRGMHASEPGTVVPTAYLAANLVLSFLAAALGGYVTVVAAGSAPVTHTVALATLVVVMGLVSARQAGGRAMPGQPPWYPWIIPLVGVAGVMVGAMAHSRP